MYGISASETVKKARQLLWPKVTPLTPSRPLCLFPQLLSNRIAPRPNPAWATIPGLDASPPRYTFRSSNYVHRGTQKRIQPGRPAQKGFGRRSTRSIQNLV